MAGTDWGEGKGIFTTIQLAKKLRFNLKVAGTGKNKVMLDKIKSLCTENVEYIGPINGQEKAKWISEAKGFILLTQLPDACPTVVGECMLSGTPIIGSTHGAVPELLNSKVGFVIDNDREFTKAILSINKIKPSDCFEYGMKNFSHRTAAQKYLEYYQKFLKTGRV
jgi:glycosyltransferase involved in cell wall biosynthesis